MNGVLVWKVPKRGHLKISNGKMPSTTTERNIACREALGMDVIQACDVVILVDDSHYYVVKNVITGALVLGMADRLAEFINKLEAVSE